MQKSKFKRWVWLALISGLLAIIILFVYQSNRGFFGQVAVGARESIIQPLVIQAHRLGDGFLNAYYSTRYKLFDDKVVIGVMSYSDCLSGMDRIDSMYGNHELILVATVTGIQKGTTQTINSHKVKSFPNGQAKDYLFVEVTSPDLLTIRTEKILRGNSKEIPKTIKARKLFVVGNTYIFFISDEEASKFKANQCNAYDVDKHPGQTILQEMARLSKKYRF